MFQHHEDSIQNMIQYFREQKGVIGLILDGSVAKGTERMDSDLDAAVIVTEERYREQKEKNQLAECISGHCTYEGGYFDVKYRTKNFLKLAAEFGSEPTRAAFYKAKVLFSSDPEIEILLQKIFTFPENEREYKQKIFYSNVWLNQNYFFRCVPNLSSYMKLHMVSEVIYSIYRLILEENRILFPCNRRLEEYVEKCENKPEKILELAQVFMEQMDVKSCDAFVQAYLDWTTFQPPKDSNEILTLNAEAYEEWWMKEHSPFVNEW